jgi:hypothetical protein
MLRKQQVQALQQSTDEQRNQSGIERTSPSGSVTRIKGQVTLDLPSCGSAAVTLATVTLPGAQLGDVVVLVPPAAGLSVAVAVGAGYVSAANTVKLQLINPTVGALDPASAVFEYVIFRQTPLTP